MTDEIGPAVRRRQLGRTLRELRVAAGFVSIQAAAERTGLSRATLSRIETAKQVILPKTVLLLCQAYGIGAPTLDHLLRLAEQSDDRGWLVDYSDTVPDWFGRFAGEEADAIEIWTFEPTYIPGACQTPEYTRAVSRASRDGVSEDELDRLVALRAARQERLVGPKKSRLIAVVDEAVLHREVGGKDVMRNQLDHLASMAARPNVTIQVLPYSAGAHPAMTGAFYMLHFPPGIGDPTIFVEVDSGALYPDRPIDFERRTWMFNRLREQALPPKDSAVLISRFATGVDPGE